MKGLTQVFSRSRSSDGGEAKELLATVDDLLTQSNRLLNSISRRLPSNQFETFEYKYTELNLMAIEVKDDVRERDQKRIFFENEEEKQSFQSDIRKLLQQCETYRNDVVTASRRVQEGTPSTSSTGYPISDELAEAPGSSSETNSPSPWLSIVADATSPDEQPERSADPGSIGPTQRFIATVACNRKDLITGEPFTPSQDESVYFRILICGNRSKRAVVVDTNPHHLDEKNANTAQDDLLRVGDMMMKSDPQKLEEHQVVDSYRGPSFIASFISTFAYTSSNLLTGGMV